MNPTDKEDVHDDKINIPAYFRSSIIIVVEKTSAVLTNIIYN